MAQEFARLPGYIDKFVPWRDQRDSDNLPLVDSGFRANGQIRPEFKNLIELQAFIASENRRREEVGKDPLKIVGVHAASQSSDHPSYLLLQKMLATFEGLGAEGSVLDHEYDMGSPEAADKIQKADGMIITTHTKRGMFDKSFTDFLKDLEHVDLKGKVVAFAHTFDDPEKDSQTGPVMLVERFFREKGCMIVPYSSLYQHTEELNEKWVERDIERGGVNVLKFIQRYANSQLQELVQDPRTAEKWKEHHGRISPAWKSIRRKVESINKQREEKGYDSLNAVIVWAGENPEGYSSHAARSLTTNFEYLGIKVENVSLKDTRIQPTKGDPELELTDVLSERRASNPRPGSMDEIYMKLLKADIIVASSPVRIFEAAARLQQFLERVTPMNTQGFLLEGKAFATIITYGEAGAVDTQSRLERFAADNGMMVIPYGGVNIRLGSEPEVIEKDEKDPAFLRKKGRKQALRRMAAMSTTLTTDILAADWAVASKIRWDHLNPYLSIVSPED